MLPLAERLNLVRWAPYGEKGIVESLFLKFHMPEEKAAFWARYTLRRQVGGEAVGCLWAVFTSKANTVAGCEVFPAPEIAVGKERFYLKIGPGELSMGRAKGRVTTPLGPVEWALNFETGGPLLQHFPWEFMYRGPFPRNKIASPHLLTRFYGTVKVASSIFAVDGARGMQGHNWGNAVAPYWIWAHAAGFLGQEDAVFEVISSRLRLGRVMSPPLTIVALRTRDREVVLNRPHQWLKNQTSLDGLRVFIWARSGRIEIRGWVEAPRETCAGLDYISSDASKVRCVNSNLASAWLRVEGLFDCPVELKTEAAATLELGGQCAPKDISVLVTC